MKKVFTNRELAHVWAGQKQETGRGSNMFFEGASIYSYGRHFEIARIVRAAVKGSAPVALFNCASYSNSTAKHKNYTRRALSHAETFDVGSMTDHPANVCAFLAQVETSRGEALRAAKYGPMHKAYAESAATTAARYVEVFKKDIPVKLRAEVRRVASLVKAGKLFTAAELAKIAASDARRAAADKARTEKSAADRLMWEAGAPARALNSAHDEAKNEDKRRAAPGMLARWAAGESVEIDVFTYWDNSLPTRLRLHDGRVETSRGAQITERRARELWAALVRGADVTGQELDNYTVTSWDGALLRVGCHDIPRAELENMARVMELPGALPAAVAAAEVI